MLWSNDSYELYCPKPAQGKHNTHFFAFITSKSLAPNRGKGTEMNAEETVKGNLFCFPSLQPSESKRPGKEFILLICHHLCKTIVISFRYSTRSKSNLFIANCKSIQHVNFCKGSIIYLNTTKSTESWFN